MLGDGGEVGFAAVREMLLVWSTVYEVLRMQPSVPLQFGRARRDFVLRSHNTAFARPREAASVHGWSRSRAERRPQWHQEEAAPEREGAAPRGGGAREAG